MAAKKGRILSGMRPTGFLHLGNYMGALEYWVRLQDEWDCFFPIVDWHMLTTGYQDTSGLRENIHQLAIDYMVAGLDPQRSVLFRQSQIKEHAELALLFSMFTPLGWLERVPTYKDQLRELEEREIATHGFLGYPVLQAADITIYKANAVPVGEDQAPHLELAREIVRRFNHLFRPVFPEPQTLLNLPKVLPGLDKRKMSKSYGNYIALSAPPEEVNQKVMSAITDPSRIRKTDPGHPEICPVFAGHTVFNAAESPNIEEQCRAGQIGCVACKKNMAGVLNTLLEPMRERRAELAARPNLIEEVLVDGEARAREVARATMAEVRDAMNLTP